MADKRGELEKARTLQAVEELMKTKKTEEEQQKYLSESINKLGEQILAKSKKNVEQRSNLEFQKKHYEEEKAKADDIQKRQSEESKRLVDKLRFHDLQKNSTEQMLRQANQITELKNKIDKLISVDPKTGKATNQVTFAVMNDLKKQLD